MNKIPQVNYDKYLQRMSDNVRHTTKALIPFYAKGDVLDVGCADGALLSLLHEFNPELKLYGIEMNETAANIATAKGFDVLCSTFEEFVECYRDEKFDTIIFSSVLHEIYSYDFTNREKVSPLIYISKILIDASKFLKPNGVIIIRDGVGSDRHCGTRTFSFKDVSDIGWLARFIESNFAYSDSSYQINKNNITISEDVLKEFLFTFTWGEKSWDREVQEMYGVLSEKEWKDELPIEVKKYLNRELIAFSAEEYAKYLSEKINEVNSLKLDQLFACSSCLSVYTLKENN